MNSLVDELYNLFKTVITERTANIKTKICVPISGGLDSRLIAGFLADRIDLVIIFGNPGAKHITYAHQIAQAVGYNKAILVTTAHKEDIEKAKPLVEKINGIVESAITYVLLANANKVIDLSKYTFVVPHMLDPYMGNNVNPLTLFKPKQTKEFWVNYEKTVSNKGTLIWKHFGNYVNPIMDDRIKDFCSNLPLRYKFHQYLYRQMFKKYFPKLAAIKRDNMNVRMDCNELTYFIARTIRYFKKKMGRYECY